MDTSDPETATDHNDMVTVINGHKARHITGGAGSILRTTTDTAGDTTTILEFAATNSAYAGGIQLNRGPSRRTTPPPWAPA